MKNSITLDAMNIGSFYGPIASKYSYTPALRARLDALYQAALRSNNRVFVLDGETCKAAQTTREGALPYMTDTTVLVEVEIPTPTQEQLEQAAKACRELGQKARKDSQGFGRVASQSAGVAERR